MDSDGFCDAQAEKKPKGEGKKSNEGYNQYKHKRKENKKKEEKPKKEVRKGTGKPVEVEATKAKSLMDLIKKQ